MSTQHLSPPGETDLAISRYLNLPVLILELSTLHNHKKCISVLYKLPSLRNFVIATQMDWNTIKWIYVAIQNKNVLYILIWGNSRCSNGGKLDKKECMWYATKGRGKKDKHFLFSYASPIKKKIFRTTYKKLLSQIALKEGIWVIWR